MVLTESVKCQLMQHSPLSESCLWPGECCELETSLPATCLSCSYPYQQCTVYQPKLLLSIYTNNVQ